MATDSAATALDRFFDRSHVRQVEPLVSGGWSGSQLWRVDVNCLGLAASFCLRRWPTEHPTPERLTLIHACLTQVAAQGIKFIPAPCRTKTGETFVRHEGQLWELLPWMPGVADFHNNPSEARIAAAMEALARFHLATAVKSGRQLELASGGRKPPEAFEFAPQPAPTFVDRLATVDRLLSGDFDRLAAAVRSNPLPVFAPQAAEILSLTSGRVKSLHAPLAAAAQQNLPLQPAIRDIHHDHVLFTGDEVTGLIDFGALRIDSPLADIARLVGSLVGDDRSAWQFALDAYERLRKLTEQDRRLIALLDQSGVVLSGLSWLGWLYLDRREMGPPAPIVKRLDEILVRLRASSV